MSWANLSVDAEVLAGMLHLTEHGIQIRDANLIVRNGRPCVVLRLGGEDLPDCEVVAIMQRLDDGREILLRLEPVK